MGVFAEFERAVIQERVRAGLARARSEGKRLGRPPIDLLKLSVMRPAHVVDINALGGSELGRIEANGQGLRLGALVRMAEAADHAEINRTFPAITQSLNLAASQQIRNMATLGGNVLQRTRCSYFRDVSYSQCNKRNPGSGCAALDGFNRSHAVLGTSEGCIASYPGDFAQALIAFDATVEIAGTRGVRTIPFAELHRHPGDTPHVESTLAPKPVCAPGLPDFPLRGGTCLFSSSTLRHSASNRLITRGTANVGFSSRPAPACLAFKCASSASS